MNWNYVQSKIELNDATPSQLFGVHDPSISEIDN